MESSSSDYASRTVTTTHLVIGEDLNHHATLYGGRCVEWCVQMAFIAASNCFDSTRSVVFMSIRSLSMRSPAKLGDIIQLTGRIDYVGESTIGVRVDAKKMLPRDKQKSVATGTFLFCTVDEEGRAVPHGLPSLMPATPLARNRWIEAEDNQSAS